MTAAAFAASFARYSEYHANVGAPGAIDAGAGQRYVTVPVQIYARLKRDATPVYMIGNVTLHRTGDIDGATTAQRSWHLHSADIKPRPGQTPPDKRGKRGDAPNIVTAGYRCMDGSGLQARFDNDADTAAIRSGGKLLAMLKGQRPASGIWYRGQGYDLIGKGRDATFTRPHLPPVACTAVDRG
ncbi:MAG: MliC family protein [Pseudomonadota bacterium]|nr:MliC family protein [Pseudomonadota bacterium]